MVGEGLLVGAGLAFLDVTQTLGTGLIPTTDVPAIVAAPLALGLAASAGAWFIAFALERLVLPNAAVVGTLILLHGWPVLLLGLRGHGAPVLTTALITAVALAAVWRGRAPNARVLGFTFVSLLLQGIAGMALLMRTVDPAGATSRLPFLSAAIVAHALLVAAFLGRGAPGQSRSVGFALAASVVATAGIGLALGASSSPHRSVAGRARTAGVPNVLLIVLDTVRADHLSAYGYGRQTSPHLEELSRQAWLYEHAYATAPYTLSSHASLFTGQIPSRHGAHPVPFVRARHDGGFADQFPLATGDTLAKRLGQAGYRTGGVAANAGFLAPRSGLAAGFESYECEFERFSQYVPTILPLAARWPSSEVPRQVSAWLKGTHTAPAVTRNAVRFIDHGEGPFLLFLNYFDAHQPYVPPSPFLDRFVPPGLTPDFGNWTTTETRPHTSIRSLVGQYDAAIAFMDAEIGRLLDHLRSTGVFDATLIVVTSDHGELFGEHGLGGGHGKALYEPLLRIPLIVKLPGQRVGERVTERVTLADLRGAIEAVASGRPLPGPPVRSPGEPRVVAEYWTPRAEHERAPELFSSNYFRAVFWSNFKLIQKKEAADELYDLGADPGEQRNLLRSDPGRAGEIRKRMLAAVPPIESMDETRPAPPVDPDVLRRVRALGYVR